MSETIFQKLYDSEINCGCQSFWDGGWEVWIGDDMNGRKAEEQNLMTFIEVEAWLGQKARELYPNSHYVLAEKIRAEEEREERENNGRFGVGA